MGDYPILPEEESVWNLDEHIQDLEDRDPILEHYLLASDDLESLNNAVVYAKRFFVGIGWPELEEKISNWGEVSYWYALNVLNGPFPAGERAIASCAMWSYLYACYVLDSRFPAGEKAIARDPAWAYDYARDVIGGRFPEGEPAIASDEGEVVDGRIDDCSSAYAFSPLRERCHWWQISVGVEGDSRNPEITAGYETFLGDIGYE